jgi:tetratricopeptide (TPR) repeat protein
MDESRPSAKLNGYRIGPILCGHFVLGITWLLANVQRTGSLVRKVKSAIIVTGMLLLSACAGIGIVSTSDPLIKLNDAEVLFMKEDRPLPAERLIQEAIAIYQERDDPHGLGTAYRAYGDLLRSPAVAKFERVYRRDGFLNKSVTFDNRLAKATEYYTKALEYYRRAEQQELATGKYDALTNVYYNMAWSNLALGARDEACVDFDRTLQAYNNNMQHNPTAHPQNSLLGTIPETITAVKKQADCK